MAAAWEECKENYVPVKEGRKPALLSPVAPVPSPELEATRKCVKHSVDATLRLHWAASRVHSRS